MKAPIHIWFWPEERKKEESEDDEDGGGDKDKSGLSVSGIFEYLKGFKLV